MLPLLDGDGKNWLSSIELVLWNGCSIAGPGVADPFEATACTKTKTITIVVVDVIVIVIVTVTVIVIAIITSIIIVIILFLSDEDLWAWQVSCVSFRLNDQWTHFILNIHSSQTKKCEHEKEALSNSAQMADDCQSQAHFNQVDFAQYCWTRAVQQELFCSSLWFPIERGVQRESSRNIRTVLTGLETAYDPPRVWRLSETE